jgi:hypothetical protein
MYTIEICNEALDRLKEGDFLVTEVGGVPVKIEYYPLDEQIEDTMECDEIHFVPGFIKRGARRSDPDKGDAGL